jgi:hypothetical protein
MPPLKYWEIVAHKLSVEPQKKLPKGGINQPLHHFIEW